MEENSLVKEITPEEVKLIDPYEISYIAMKNGSIIMVIEQNINVKNSFKNEGQDSPNFNIKGKKIMSYITPKIKIDQEENEEDYNVYYSNNYNNKNNIKKKTYELNDNIIKKSNYKNNNDSFYSYDDINQVHKIQKKIKTNNIINDEYIYNNDNINEKQYQNNNLITNNIVNYNTNNNLENNSPYYIVKRKYRFYKKTNCNDSPFKESKVLNKTFNAKMPSKRQNNLYILKNNKNNMTITHSKYSIKNNKKNNYIRTIRTPDSRHKNNNINYYYFPEELNEKNVKEESKVNKILIDSNFENNNFYKTYNKSLLNNLDSNNINSNKIDYSLTEYKHHSSINNESNNLKQYNNRSSLNNESYLNQYNNSSSLNNESNYLKLKNENQIFRSKTPSIEIKGLKRNINKKTNSELKRCLTTDNLRFFERKELSKPKKTTISNYIQKKDFNGKTIHVFENK